MKTNNKKIQRLKLRYGQSLFDDLESVRSTHFYNLSSVARKYGISREYVRQIYKMLYKEGFTKKKRQKREQRQISESLSCINDPRYKMAEHKKNGPGYQGVLIEHLFFVECKNRGFEIEFPCNIDFDLVVNGYKIDVKSASRPRLLAPTSKTKHFSFQISKKQRSVCDFFACYIKPFNAFYIIPNDEKGGSFDVYRAIYINETQKQYTSSKNKYHEYKNLFEQLKPIRRNEQ